MSSNKTTTNTNQYAPGAMANYSSWMAQLQPMLSGMMSNPFGSPSFNMNLQQQTKAASQLGQRNMRNSLQSFGNQGLGTTGGAMQQLMGTMSRYGSNVQMQGYNNAFNQAQTNQWNAASLGTSAFGNPLSTGNTSTQTTSGVGSWLPQILGSILGGASSLLTGGLSGGGNAFGAGTAGGAAISGLPMPSQSPFSLGSNQGYGNTPSPSALAPFSGNFKF